MANFNSVIEQFQKKKCKTCIGNSELTSIPHFPIFQLCFKFVNFLPQVLILLFDSWNILHKKGSRALEKNLKLVGTWY